MQCLLQERRGPATHSINTALTDLHGRLCCKMSQYIAVRIGTSTKFFINIKILASHMHPDIANFPLCWKFLESPLPGETPHGVLCWRPVSTF